MEYGEQRVRRSLWERSGQRHQYQTCHRRGRYSAQVQEILQFLLMEELMTGLPGGDKPKCEPWKNLLVEQKVSYNISQKNVISELLGATISLFLTNRKGIEL